MLSPDLTTQCPKCKLSTSIRPKMLLMGKASPKLLFPEERAGYTRKDQLAVDECKPDALADAPLDQFIEGYYCDHCGFGFAPNAILRAKHN